MHGDAASAGAVIRAARRSGKASLVLAIRLLVTLEAEPKSSSVIQRCHHVTLRLYPVKMAAHPVRITRAWKRSVALGCPRQIADPSRTAMLCAQLGAELLYFRVHVPVSVMVVAADRHQPCPG